jgi:hypothetical protein
MGAQPNVDSRPSHLETGIIGALVYADLFDYPLTLSEIHRYLVGQAAPLTAIEERLTGNGWLRERLGSNPPFWFLADREHLARVRREREAYAHALWPLAWRYGGMIAALPFVRLVAVSGSLAMNNVTSPQDDIDFLIVTQSNRVWLTRGLAILIVRLARQQGAILCPNYVVAEHRLGIDSPSLFAAHELAQMVPLYGLESYRRLLNSNPWIAEYLPNASARQTSDYELGRVPRIGKSALENMLGGRLGNGIERWERERKIAQLRLEALQQGGAGTQFGPDLCKGHMGDHASVVNQRYQARLEALGI